MIHTRISKLTGRLALVLLAVTLATTPSLMGQQKGSGQEKGGGDETR